MALLELKGLKRFYGEGAAEVRALDGVDLKVDEGEIIALLGPSGSGKSTLLNCISALDEPTAGEYEFESVPVPSGNSEKMTTFRRENIGFIFQSFHLLADLTALENVMLIQQIAGVSDEEKARSLLASVGLEGLEDRFPSEMSGGQQQRVGIARSLAKNPRLLLGDEPTGNLDSETTRNVMKVLSASCKDNGTTAIFVTHDPTLTRYASRVISLDSGRIISDEAGPTSTLEGNIRNSVEDATDAIRSGLSKAGGVISGVVEKVRDKVGGE